LSCRGFEAHFEATLARWTDLAHQISQCGTVTVVSHRPDFAQQPFNAEFRERAFGAPIDRSSANLATLEAINAERETPIKIRQAKYLNNIVEHYHRAVKRIVRPMLGFKDFRCARILLTGIELMHMIARGQMKDGGIGLPQLSSSTPAA
jgi:protein tyrosine phosphatase (PTP) superfamily phosphohydrolase (DUF442 family)